MLVLLFVRCGCLSAGWKDLISGGLILSIDSGILILAYIHLLVKKQKKKYKNKKVYREDNRLYSLLTSQQLNYSTFISIYLSLYIYRFI